MLFLEMGGIYAKRKNKGLNNYLNGRYYSEEEYVKRYGKFINIPEIEI